ncbi:MAG: hypothetical protein QOJ65_2223 [Fimbriimonadaceae bacterium]|jgi:hypothetical protein|nr:hypothetical protein [Fimbriimonadaceae bacterium]
MLKAFKFAKPKGPGFGISAHYYLSVLSTKPVMPALWDLINPQGENGAVVGFGVPLTAGATKDVLRQPMGRGGYALASKDRKTVIKLLVLSKDEAGFDPEALIRSRLAAVLESEVISRIRATWTLGQATFESHDPDVYPALRFHLALVKRLAELTEGAIADPLSQRYLLPNNLLGPITTDTGVDVLDICSVGTADRPDGMHAYTLGLQKLALPELEIVGLAPDVKRLAAEFLLSAAQAVVQGNLIQSGVKLGAPTAFFEAREGGYDVALWEGIKVLELLPPTQITATDALEIWDRERKLS